MRYIDNSSFIWEHEKDSLKRFIETLNACQPTIKFTAEWLKEKINLLYVNVKLRNRELETYLHIKPNDTHQFLDSTSCHSYHCKKSRPNKSGFEICSDNKTIDQCLNNLEKGLMERGYSERMVRTQILKTRSESRYSFLNRGIPELMRVNFLLTSLTI